MQVKNPMPNLNDSKTPILNKMIFHQIRIDKNESTSAFYQYRKNFYKHYPGSSIFQWTKEADEVFYDFTIENEETYDTDDDTMELIYMKFMIDA